MKEQTHPTRRAFLALSAGALLGAVPAAAQERAGAEIVSRYVKIGEIPALVVSPRQTRGRSLVIWLTGFSGSKDSVKSHLQELAARGFVAISFDPYQHGDRRIEEQAQLVSRVRGNIRRYFWPILARSAEEVPLIIDWAVKELGVKDEVGVGGISMGGDISVAAAGVDRRVQVVSAAVATPDWLRAGSFEPPGEPDAAAQADFDRRNPATHLRAYRHKPAIAFQSGADDRQVPPDAGERFVAALKPIYGADADRLKVNLFPNVGHAFPPEMWTASLAWFEQHLGKQPSP
ncbi:MAG: alpha/beta hydrolase family protein [Armatimonadota bacterium]